MFGNTGFGTQSGGLFGQKPSGDTTNTQRTPATNTKNLFGQSSQPSSNTATTSNLFGGGSSIANFGQLQQQQPAQTKTPTFITSPESAKTPAASTAPFTLVATKPSTETVEIMKTPATTTVPLTFGADKPSIDATSNIFGNTGFGTQSGGLFGQKPGTTPNTQSSIFGTSATNTTPNLFGQPSSNTGTTSNLFGGGSSTTSFGQLQQQQQPQTKTPTFTTSTDSAKTPAASTAPFTSVATKPSNETIEIAKSNMFGQSSQPSSNTATTSNLFGGGSSIASFGQLQQQQPPQTKTLTPISSTESAKTPAASTAPLTSVATKPPTGTSVEIAKTPATSTSLMFGADKPSTATASHGITKMTYKDLEDSLNRLVIDFTNQENHFLDEVLELNAYDTVLRQNQQKLLSADNEVKQLEKEKDFFVHEVEMIGQQQKELETMVDQLEKTLGLGDYTEGEPFGIRQNEMTTNADLKRQDIYRLQMTVDAQLKQSEDDIGDLCEQMTELQAWKEDGLNADDSQTAVMEQIRQILKKQLDSLNWVDKQSEELSKKVKKISSDLAPLPK